MRTEDRLNRIFDKTDGCCHICHKKLSFSNYGVAGAKGNWEVEHSVARANGGTDHLNNLYAACLDCNREKGTYPSRTARAWNGNTRAPYNREKKEQIRSSNTTTGALVGGLLGLCFGPLGAVIGAGIGASMRHNNSPKR